MQTLRADPQRVFATLDFKRGGKSRSVLGMVASRFALLGLASGITRHRFRRAAERPLRSPRWANTISPFAVVPQQPATSPSSPDKFKFEVGKADAHDCRAAPVSHAFKGYGHA
jgi:hypothetical protein